MPNFDSQIYERDIYQDTVYSAWLKNTNERDVLEQVLNDHADWWCKDNLSILDVGCGPGSAARRVFNILDKKGLKYTFTGVDPYQDQLKRFAEAFPERQDFEMIQSKIEDFTPSRKYDFVMLIHALYYVDSMEPMIKKLADAADKMIIVHHGKLGINEVHQQFRRYVKPGPHIISTWENVQNVLDTLGIKYTLEVRDTEVNLFSCKDPKNKEGRKLIKFFLEHSELPENVIEEVSEWHKSRPDIMKQDVGFFLIG